MPGSNRFVRVPTELLEALLETPLNGTQWRILFWVIRRTLGWNREMTPFSWYRIARDLALDRGGVVRTGNRLMQFGIVSVAGNHIGVEQDPADWQRSKPAQQRHGAMTDVGADQHHRKALTGIIASDDERHRKRGQESSLFRPAKDSSKDRLKTYKNRRSQTPENSHQDPTTTNNIERRLLAGEAKPIPGKYERISQ